MVKFDPYTLWFDLEIKYLYRKRSRLEQEKCDLHLSIVKGIYKVEFDNSICF